jgi:hypothetical protein
VASPRTRAAPALSAGVLTADLTRLGAELEHLRGKAAWGHVDVFSSTLAVCQACNNVSTRIWFKMGETGTLPKWFGAVHPVHRTPAMRSWPTWPSRWAWAGRRLRPERGPVLPADQRPGPGAGGAVHLRVGCRRGGRAARGGPGDDREAAGAAVPGKGPPPTVAMAHRDGWDRHSGPSCRFRPPRLLEETHPCPIGMLTGTLRMPGKGASGRFAMSLPAGLQCRERCGHHRCPAWYFRRD